MAAVRGSIDRIQAQLKGLLQPVVSICAGAFFEDNTEKTWAKDTEIQNHPVLTYCSMQEFSLDDNPKAETLIQLETS